MSSTSTQKIVVTATGAASALGVGREATCAAIGAGIVPFTEYPLYRCIPEDVDWDDNLPLFAATVPFANIHWSYDERLNRLALSTIEQVFAESNLSRRSLSRTGLFFALPGQEGGDQNSGIGSAWLPSLLKLTGLGSIANISQNTEGHSGFLAQLEEAVKALSAGKLDFCLVGGVDSYFNEQRLGRLDEHWRIKSERNVDGFVPGEASFVFLLETEQNALARGAVPLASIGGCGYAIEKHSINSDKSSSGEALVASIKESMASAHQESLTSSDEASAATFAINNVYCGLNGESYNAYEWGLMLSRLSTELAQAEELYHPADSCGDVGAATGGMLLLCSINDLLLAEGKQKHALLWSASDSGIRRSCVVSHYGVG